MKKIKIYWLFILLIQIIVIVIFANNKNNFFVDEIYSFAFANSYYMPTYLNSDYYNVILNGEFWHNILTVQESERFDIKSVIYNIQTDVHPPLYYIILHMVSSFFPDVLSKWIGIVPNIVFFIINQVLILAISKRIFKNIDFEKNKIFILLPCIFYGFSLGVINTVLFTRMYMLLSLFALLLLYLNLILLENVIERKSVRNILLAIFITIVLGVLTQYIYIIYAGLIFIGYTIYLLKDKYYSEWKKYLITGILSSICVYILYPKMLEQLMTKNPARDIIDQKSILDNIISFKGLLILISRDLFGGFFITVILCFVMLILIFYIIKYKIKIEINKHIILMISVSLFYLILISKISPFISNRYLFIIYPLISISFIGLLYSILKKILKKEKYIVSLFFLLIISINFISYRFDNIDYKDDNYVKIENEINKKDDFILVNYAARWNPDVMLLAEKAKSSYMIVENNIINPSNNKRQWIYISNKCKISDEKILEQINKNKNFKEINKVYESLNGRIYLLEK